MSEIINFNDYDRENIVSWAIISLFTGKCEEESDWLRNKMDEGELNPENLTVECKINGYEVPFTRLMKRIEDQIDTLIRAEALEMVEEELNTLNQKINLFNEGLFYIKEQIEDKLVGGD